MEDESRAELAALAARVEALERQLSLAQMARYKLSHRLPEFDAGRPFMRYSTCSAEDVLHPRYTQILYSLINPFCWHRKAWEWVFIYHHLTESGVVKPGARGLVFGVGTERLPALFAKDGASIVATDAPHEVGVAQGWAASGQHTTALAALRNPRIVDDATFDANVTFQPCDMKNISPDLTAFDFNWSSCCFEHLGSLQAGMDFVVNAVEQTLRPGGWAVHTTEFNLLSNEETVATGGTVLYRRKDLEGLVERLRDRGHNAMPFTVAPDSHYYDYHVDVPPYTGAPHLKILLGEYVTTSAGIVVQRGN
jgi:hypothetical protein